MILYFSGTGNSRYVAEGIAGICDDELVSINSYLKKSKSGVFSSDKPFVIVCPVYCYQIPHIITKFIKKSLFKNNNIYFIVTYGSFPGNPLKSIRQLCEEKEFNLLGYEAIRMPENYIALFKAPDKVTCENIVSQARDKIFEIGNKIKNNESFFREKSIDKIPAHIFNPVFYKFIVSTKGFHVNDNCVSCGLCAKRCPLNSIYFVNKHPRWSKYCTHCMACICGCVHGAIEYKNRTKNKSRYFLYKKFYQD